MSKQARERVDKTIGLYLDADICRNPDLTLAERIVLAQVRQMDKARRSGKVVASNDFLAEACGVNLSTVKHAIPELVRRGWLRVEDSGYRVLLIDWTHVDSAIAAVAQASAGDIPVGAGSARAGANPDPTSANPAPPSKERSDEMDNMTDKNAALPQESILIQEDNLLQESMPSHQPQQPENGTDFQGVFTAWSEQACGLMHPRTWDRRQRDGTRKPVKLEVPVPGRAGAADLAALSTIAAAAWPDADPAMALRQALRAAAWTLEPRDRLQQRACGFGDGSLGIRTVLTIGGKGDPTAFVRERCTAVPPPPPPPPAVKVDDADAGQLIAICGGLGLRWNEPRWSSCWLEAAARAKALPECPMGSAQLLCFCALDKTLRMPDGVPFPWIIDSVTAEDIEGFWPKYLRDRENAWRGGPSRSRRDSGYIPPLYDRCVGAVVAQAAVVELGLAGMGCDQSCRIRSRRCLLCAAADLEANPGLVKCVRDWNGTAAELAQAMLELAQRTQHDDAPDRGIECGMGQGYDWCGPSLPSWVVCRYGDAKGVYTPCVTGPFVVGAPLPPKAQANNAKRG